MKPIHKNPALHDLERKNLKAITNALQQLESQAQILLLLPDKLIETHKQTLEKNVAPLKMNLTIIPPQEVAKVSLASFDYILSFRTTHPTLETSSEEDSLFEITGVEAWDSIPIPFWEPHLHTNQETRFLRLSKEVRKQESNPHFVYLAKQQATIHQKQISIQQKEQNILALTQECEEYDNDYYKAISYILLDGVQKVSGLISLGLVMKRLTKILVVDDFEKRTLSQLASHGFARDNMSVIPIAKLNKLYHSYNQEYQKKNPKQTTSFKQFVAKCNYFDDYDVVLLNSWNLNKNTLPIQMRLKQKQVLSRKENRIQEKNPEEFNAILQRLQKEYQEYAKQTKQVEAELKIAETTQGISESNYQTLIKKRKRLIKWMKNKAETIKTYQNPTKQITKTLMYTVDLVEVYNNYEEWMNLLEHKEDPAKTELFSFTKKIKENLDKNSLVALHALFRKRLLNERDIHLIKQEARKLLEHMDEYAGAYPLPGNTKYEQAISVHLSRILEIGVLSAGISDVNNLLFRYQGNYFEVEKGNIDWDKDWLNDIKVRTANKTGNLDVSLFRKLFDITDLEIEERMRNFSLLPTETEFTSHQFNLLIINTESYPHQEILNCIRERNVSKNPHIPILLLLPQYPQPDIVTLLKYRMSIGLKAGANEAYTFDSPSHLVYSLTDEESILPIVEEIFGMPTGTLDNLAGEEDTSEVEGKQKTYNQKKNNFWKIYENPHLF